VASAFNAQIRALKALGLKGHSWPERPLKAKGHEASKGRTGSCKPSRALQAFKAPGSSEPLSHFRVCSYSVLLRLSRPFKVLKSFKTCNGLEGLHSCRPLALESLKGP
jgi:hypothetical protein